MLEYYTQLMLEIKADAAAEQRSKLTSFIHKSISIINEKEEDEWKDWVEAYYDQRISNKPVRLDAYHYDSDEPDKLTLFISDFQDNPDSEIGKLNRSEISKLLKPLKNFYDAVKSGKIQPDIGSPALYSLIRNITGSGEKAFNEQNGYLQLVLLTNKIVDSAFSIERETDEATGLQIQYMFYDLNRLKDSLQEPIVLDLTSLNSLGLPFLKVEQSESVDFFESYLFVLPGAILAQCYDKYRTQLLEGNVRAYLQQKGKVNKGIAKTLRTQPYVFFIYNNGLTITADDIEFSSDGTRLLRIHGAQVVNGGQTMATIHDLWKSKTDIEEVSVQVKLTIVHKKVAEILVPNISLYSNSQNAVKATDLSSNDTIQRAIETCSRRYATPAQNYWFYERTRGQYNSHISHCLAKEKKKFQLRYPKEQLVTQTDFAKTVMTFELKPSWVSKGGAKNFNRFKEEIAAVYQVAMRTIPTASWYKNSIAKHIIFKASLKAIGAEIRQKNPGFSPYKALINNYSIALFCYILQENGGSVNFQQIWNSQKISTQIIMSLVECSTVLIGYICRHHMVNHVEWLKKDEAWNEIKQMVAPGLKDSFKLERFGAEVHPYPPELLFTDGQLSQRVDASQNKKIVYQLLPDHFWTSLRQWIGARPSASLLAASKLLDRRLKKQKLSNRECEDLISCSLQQKRRGWQAPETEAQDELLTAAARIIEISGNPISIFCDGESGIDILTLERTSDLSSGSRYLDALFELFPHIRELESDSNEIEPGAAVAYPVTLTSGLEKKVVLLYSRKSEKSVFFADIYAKSLSQLHSLASTETDSSCGILMPDEGEGLSKSVRELIESELFTETIYYCANED